MNDAPPRGEPKNAVPDDLERLLDASGAKISFSRHIDHGTQYRVTRGPDTAMVNVYASGKASTGGKRSPLLDMLENWRIARTNVGAGSSQAHASPVEPDGTPRVGTDEAGKGDYFGPLVVAGIRITGKEAAEELQELDVRDSKTLGVAAARLMADRILEAVGSQNVRVVALSPREYEARRSAAGNVNRLLDEIDAKIIDELKGEVELIVVDQYSPSAWERLKPFVPEWIGLEVRRRAEDDAAVAAASVVARARQLEEMDRLSEWVGFPLPRGSTAVIEPALRVVKEVGEEGLKDVAKTSFGITAHILGG